MSITRIKLLKETITDFRTRGELDEEKWKAYKESRDLRNISFAGITFIAASFSCFTGSIFIFGMVIILCIFFWWHVINMLIDQYILYTIGQVTNSYVIEKTLIRVGSGINTYRLVCKFFDKNNKEYIIRFQNDLSKNTKESRPTVGDKIEIIYLKENPKISVTDCLKSSKTA